MAYTGSYTSATDEAAATAGNLKDKAAAEVGRIASSVEDAANKIASQGREAGEQVQIVADNFKTALDKSIKDQPITTLAVTAALGFVIGALWKS